MKKSIFFLSIILAVNLIGTYYSWYIKWWWFDIVSHSLGGFFVAMLMSAYLKEQLSGEIIKRVLIIVGATIFIGVVWEFAEYIANQLLTEPFYRWFGIRAYFMGDLNDTVIDLLLDISGALLYSLFYLFWRPGFLHSFRR